MKRQQFETETRIDGFICLLHCCCLVPSSVPLLSQVRTFPAVLPTDISPPAGLSFRSMPTRSATFLLSPATSKQMSREQTSWKLGLILDELNRDYVHFYFIFQSLVRAVKRRPQLRGDVISEVMANGFWRALT